MIYVGKNIIITGGTGGIGYGLAKEFLQQGAQNIALLDIADPNNLSAALQSEYPKNKVVYFSVDVRRRDELKMIFGKFVEQFGYIDIVVGSAGLFNENKPEDVVAVNLASAKEDFCFENFLTINFYFVVDGHYKHHLRSNELDEY